MSGLALAPSRETSALAETARVYRRFADDEARDRSPLYEALARQVAADDEILRFLLTLPKAKRQPNLLLAAVRHLCGTPADGADFRRRLLAARTAVRGLMLERSTQTNEPARCAVLLPALVALPQPLALIEVGASAGLCLLPHLYGYDYGSVPIDPPAAAFAGPRFSLHAQAEDAIARSLPANVLRPRN